jgi:hypothetical protein
MSLFIRGDEKYSKHFPVVGVTPSVYAFNNLQNTLGPYVNKIQFYDPYTGRLGPSFTPNTMIEEMLTNLKQSNPLFAEASRNQIKTSVYNNDTKKFTVGLIGNDEDIKIARTALDAYLSKKETKSVATEKKSVGTGTDTVTVV